MKVQTGSFALSIVLTAALTACGGGGGGSAPSIPATINSSVSVPAPTTSSGAGAPVAPVVQAPVTPPSGPNLSPSAFGLPAVTVIPDPVFRAALASFGINANGANEVDTAAILALTKIEISRDGCPPQSACVNTFATGTVNVVHDLTGIENFRNLTSMRIDNQAISSVNVSALTALTFLSLWQEPITSIDLSHNTHLQTLGLSETALTNVDLSALTNIVELDLQNDSNSTLPYTTGNGVNVQGFSSLDFTHQVNLQRLYIYGNNFTALDLSSNHQLAELWANKNHLTSVNLNGYSNVNYVILNDNNLTALDIRGVANAGVPFRLYTNGNPNLSQITVTNANLSVINGLFANTGHGYYKDVTTTVVGN